MKHFVIIQMAVVRDEIIGRERNAIMGTIVRQVQAESKEIAIGKFVIATQGIDVIKKLEIECYDLSELKYLD